MRRVKVTEVVGQGHLDWGVENGVLTITADRGSLSIPWPAPAPKHGYGSWMPVVLGQHPDGSTTALWTWIEGEGGSVLVPWRRADRHPLLNVPPHTQLLPKPEDADAVRG